MFIYQCIEGIRARFLNFIIPVKSHELQQKITRPKRYGWEILNANFVIMMRQYIIFSSRMRGGQVCLDHGGKNNWSHNQR
jgi:hypothetical protein